MRECLSQRPFIPKPLTSCAFDLRGSLWLAERVAGRLPTLNAGGPWRVRSIRAGPWLRTTPGPGFHIPVSKQGLRSLSGVHLHDEWGRENEETRESDVL